MLKREFYSVGVVGEGVSPDGCVASVEGVRLGIIAPSAAPGVGKAGSWVGSAIF